MNGSVIVHTLPTDHKCYMKAPIVNNADKKKSQEATLIFYDSKTFSSDKSQLISNLMVKIGVFWKEEVSLLNNLL